MADKLYDDGRTTRVLREALDPDVDWSEVGPELAFLLQETRREMLTWMQEARHATQIADAWKQRYIGLVMTREKLSADDPMA